MSETADRTTIPADRAEPTALRAWITERVAAQLRMDPADIKPDQPLPDYGLDSVYALAVVVEIEDHLGLELDSTMIWDNPTVDSLVEVLTRQVDAAS